MADERKEAAMGAGRYDVIVVGARVAGAATAMLLARQGLRVLAVDRVSFPSDTISSHQLQVPGAALLHRWGLLGKLTAAGTPPARRGRDREPGDRDRREAVTGGRRGRRPPVSPAARAVVCQLLLLGRGPGL